MTGELIDDLVIQNTTKIVFLVMDGLGGLQTEGYSGTELELANTPHLDHLAKEGVCGMITPVAPGIAAGSGPGHFALFGYDPVQGNIGRGVLSAAGLEFELTDKDVAARVNYATIDGSGNVIDRRAGRIDTDTNQRICQTLREKVKLTSGYEFFLETEKEHRALFVLRGEGLSGELSDTDPQQTGVPPLPIQALSEDAERAAELVDQFLAQAKKVLAAEPKANMILLRGFAKHKQYRTMWQRFKLKALCLANYPMYRGISRLVGMTIHPVVSSVADQIKALADNFSQYDFFFLHAKATDAGGEDGDFSGKVRAIEEIDALIPRIVALQPEVLVVTGDHSTPAALRAHSWHPVPVVLWSKYARRDDCSAFNEKECLRGGLGHFASKHLMALALAHALRVKKFGA